MESATVEQNPAPTPKIPQVPAESGTGVVDGSKAFVKDSGQVLADAATAVLDASRTAVREIAEASGKLARDVRLSVPPATVVETPPPAPADLVT